MRVKKFLVYAAAVLMIIIGIKDGYRRYTENYRAVETILISYGSRGDNVIQLQTRLSELGYYTGSIDGVFGQGTYEAVRRFQQDNGLNADGIAGSATLTALGLMLGGDRNNVTDEDIEIIARAIYGEGRGEPYEGQVAIGAVILNRVASPDFPNTVSEVVYQTGAFDAVRDGQINLSPNETAYQAALDAVAGWDPTGGALYYWNPATATSAWIWTVPITASIGRHVFGVK